MARKATVETIIFTPDEAREWLLPPFQRPLRVNAKVQALAETIKADSGIVPGMLTFGMLGKKKYLIDGQHRREAFLLSGRDEGIADTRIHDFDSMADMGVEFVHLNSRLVTMRPDDMLRGVEGSLPQLGRIRAALPFIGYGAIRRVEHSPLVSMSALIRCWAASSMESPASGGTSAIDLARNLVEDETSKMIRFMQLAMTAWGRDQAYHRLWSVLNLTICMWLYRRIVVGASRTEGGPGYARVQPVTQEQFKQCLMALSANADYCEWLIGRNLSERDRSPCLNRIKSIFSSRLSGEKGVWRLPQPPWAAHRAIR